MYADGNQNESLIIFNMSNQPSPEFEQDIFSGIVHRITNRFITGEHKIV